MESQVHGRGFFVFISLVWILFKQDQYLESHSKPWSPCPNQWLCSGKVGYEIPSGCFVDYKCPVMPILTLYTKYSTDWFVLHCFASFLRDKETNVINRIIISLILNKTINYLFSFHKTKCHFRFTNIANNNLAGDPFYTPAISGISLSAPNCLLVIPIFPATTDMPFVRPKQGF